MHDEDDVNLIFRFCQSNTQYYEYCGKDISAELFKDVLHITPPGIPIERKYYIGFFMMNHLMQGKNIGSKIIHYVFDYLKSVGFTMCMLGIDKDNPQ